MRIDYYGQLPDRKHNTRCAVIEFKESETQAVEKIIDLIYKEGYHDISGFDECCFIGVWDKEEYNDLVKLYKEAKKQIKIL